jgi:hypothetical protein
MAMEGRSEVYNFVFSISFHFNYGLRGRLSSTAGRIK